VEAAQRGLAVFKTHDVAARQTVRIDVQMWPGIVRQTTLVRDFAPLVNTENPAIGLGGHLKSGQ
jgi:hypothetical protein